MNKEEPAYQYVQVHTAIDCLRRAYSEVARASQIAGDLDMPESGSEIGLMIAKMEKTFVKRRSAMTDNFRREAEGK